MWWFSWTLKLLSVLAQYVCAMFTTLLLPCGVSAIRMSWSSVCIRAAVEANMHRMRYNIVYLVTRATDVVVATDEFNCCGGKSNNQNNEANPPVSVIISTFNGSVLQRKLFTITVVNMTKLPRRNEVCTSEQHSVTWMLICVTSQLGPRTSGRMFVTSRCNVFGGVWPHKAPELPHNSLLSVPSDLDLLIDFAKLQSRPSSGMQ